MLRLTYQEQLTFHSDTCMMRPANRPAQLLVNADYDRVLLLDLARRSTWTISFAPAATDPFLIYNWLVAPDGSASYLTSSEPDDFGLRLDHERGITTRFHSQPEYPLLTELCWQIPPSLHALDYDGQVWTIDDTRGVVPATAQVLEQEPARSYLELRPHWIPRKGANHGQGVYAVNRHPQTQIGYLPPAASRQPALLAPDDTDVIDVTHYQDNLFICYEEKIEQHVGETMRTVLTPSPDRYFIGVNVLLVGDQPILCVMCTLQNYAVRPGTFIDLYRLEGEQQPM